jgi:hypothetical protein
VHERRSIYSREIAEEVDRTWNFLFGNWVLGSVWVVLKLWWWLLLWSLQDLAALEWTHAFIIHCVHWRLFRVVVEHHMSWRIGMEVLFYIEILQVVLYSFNLVPNLEDFQLDLIFFLRFRLEIMFTFPDSRFIVSKYARSLELCSCWILTMMSRSKSCAAGILVDGPPACCCYCYYDFWWVFFPSQALYRFEFYSIGI